MNSILHETSWSARKGRKYHDSLMAAGEDFGEAGGDSGEISSIPEWLATT